MLNTVQIGDIGESVAIHLFTKNFYIVSKPLSNNARYDLIVEINNHLYKVQVKTTNSVKENKMTFATKTTNYEKGKWSSNAYQSNEVDVFFLYCIENEWTGLFIPNKNEPIQTELNIRLVPPKNNQLSRVKMANDYEFSVKINELTNLSGLGSNPS